MFPKDPCLDGPQPATLAIYTLLSHLRPTWGGTLILSCGLGPVGSSVALAATVAGATCLALEPDPTICRAAMRAGACDFFVNTVDEALRVLKNEIRRHKPLAVALELDYAVALDELRERGVLPQLFTTGDTPEIPAIGRLVDALQPVGMAVFDLGTVTPQLQSLRDQQGLTLTTHIVETAAALRAFDAQIQQLVPSTDPRHRWLTAAPRLFPRDRPYRRAVLLTPQEQTAILTKQDV